jgi:tubulin-like protein
MSGFQSPTLIIGLGGTGVAVLRKFKQRFIELYGKDAQRLVKILAIDTAVQPTMPEPTLGPQEFLHLGVPPIDVADVVDMAPRVPALNWLCDANVPAFQIGTGAGMKRLYGHIAYFFRGATIRKRLEEAAAELMHNAGKAAAQGSHPGFRVFIVSSLCGGTGTGMYLDIAYMAHDIVKNQMGLGAPQSFGLLFLPSAFQELKGSPFWSSINANGFAALQELQYYMTLSERTTGSTTLRLPDKDGRVLQLTSEPFQYCYLVGGVNESGNPVANSKDLYDRTAEFLFMTATSDIGSQLMAVAVDRDKCFASFGSSNLQLPQARSLQKYFILMGREILNDIFCPPKEDYVPPKIVEKFDGASGYRTLGDLTTDAAAFLEDEVFSKFDLHSVPASQGLVIINRIIPEMKVAETRYREKLSQRAAQMASAVQDLVHQTIQTSWNLEAGTIQRVTRIIDETVAELRGKIQMLQSRMSAAELDEALAQFRSSSMLGQLFSKGNAQLARFKAAAHSAFEGRAEAILAAEYQTAFAKFTNDLLSLKDKLGEIVRAKSSILAQFESSAQSHLTAIARDQGNLGLLDTANLSEDDDYASDRRGLLMRCRSRDEVKACIGNPDKPAVLPETLVRGLFPVVEEFVDQKVFTGSYVDDTFYERLSQAKINLQLKDTFEQPRRESYLFVNGDNQLQQTLKNAIATAPGGFQSPQVQPGVNPGTATFVRMLAEFKLRDLVEVREMGSAYDAKSKTPDSLYLDLPTHYRSQIREDTNENLGPELFFFGCMLLGIMEVGQNYFLKGRRLLHRDEPDSVARRKAAYEMVKDLTIRNEIEGARTNLILGLNGNEAFVPHVRKTLGTLPPAGTDEYSKLLRAEREAVEKYLATLPVQSQIQGV